MSKQLANEIRQYAKKHKMSLGDVLKMTNVHSSQLSNWENDEYNARPETEWRVRSLLGTEVATFSVNRNVTVEDVPFPEDEKTVYRINLIGDVMEKDSYTASYKIELIRFLISK